MQSFNFESELRQRNLYQQVMLARFWLPITIVGVVLVHQLSIVPLGGDRWQFWSVLLFYSILGPIVTFLTLNWIASEVKRREEAQSELKILYSELQASHALLGDIQNVTEQFASAPDLEASLSAASKGITRVTSAKGAAVFLGEEGRGIRQHYQLSPALIKHAITRHNALLEGQELAAEFELERHYWVLTTPLDQAGNLRGSIHAYYTRPPNSEQRESFHILSREFSAIAEAARSRTRDVMTLIEVDRSIRAEGNLERLLETLLTQMMARAEASMGGVYLADGERLLQLKVCHGLAKHINTALRLGEGLIGFVAETKEPHIVSELKTKERQGPVLANATSMVALPLLVEQELLGVVVLAHEDKDHFDEAGLSFLNLIAGQVSLAVSNARAYLQSEELAIAEERARIAREIHDGVAQSLAFSALKLDLVSRLLKSDPSKAISELNATKLTLREMIKELRRSIFALRPIDLEHHGFTEVVQRYCHDYGQQNGIQLELDLKTMPQLSTKSEAVLFRIFQEAMHNVAKHAEASHVNVSLGTSEGGLGYVAVQDNGIGFDLNAITDRVTSAGGLGIKQMKERIEGRGGKLEIETLPGQGTSICAALPE